MKVSIIGCGSYGTALAQLISSNVNQVFLFGRDFSLLNEINKYSLIPRIIQHPRYHLKNHIKYLDYSIDH